MSDGIILAKGATVRLGGFDWTINNTRVLNSMSDHIHGEHTVDMQVVLTRKIAEPNEEKKADATHED